MKKDNKNLFPTDVEKILKQRTNLVQKEIETGMRTVRKYPKSVSIFGSARLKPSDKYYKKAVELGGRLAEAGFAVITGGGGGIMQAGNEGAFKAGGDSIGFNIKLPHEQVLNPFVTENVDFHYFFTRKVSLVFSGEMYVYFPGGFGTLDEFFEAVTLIQTGKVDKTPIILFGKAYWGPLVKFFEKSLLEKFKTISKKDLKLFKVTDNIDEIVAIAKKAKMHDEYKK